MRESACSGWTWPETVCTTAAPGAGKTRGEERKGKERRGKERKGKEVSTTANQI